MEDCSFDVSECFFQDHAEEFYEDSQYKDLFKKFEILTPPHSPCQSPHHDPFPPDKHSVVDKRLERVKEKLATNSEEITPSPELSLSCELCVNLQSSLIQDCMWSGPCLAVSGIISNSAGTIIMKSDQKKCASNCTDITSGQCVDPTAVFPYQIEIARKMETTTFNLGSTADSPSPSESEDEEIDVVTVVHEKLARRRHSPSNKMISHSSLNSHLAAMHNYSSPSTPPASVTMSFSAPQSPLPSHQKENLHSYAGHKRLRPTSMPASPLPTKKQRSLLNNTDLKNVQNSDLVKHVAQRLKSHNTNGRQSSRNSSDSEGEDVNKRAQHNVLERKRRNDLKYSFLRLRDNVPELSKQERSPKVTILKLSSDFIRSLTAKNKRLESEHARLKARHEQLQQRLAYLRRECL